MWNVGLIKRIIEHIKVGVPPHNTRFTVELCENVHVHYRNLRLEFSPDEFVRVLDSLKEIDLSAVRNFRYSQNSFREIARLTLPEKTEFDDRLQVEEQQNGQTHIHYRNLRLEFY